MTCPSATWTSHSLPHREARAGRLRRSVGSSTATCDATDGEVIEGSDGIGLRPESHTPGCEACVPVVEVELAVEPRLHVVTERDDALGVPLTERRGLHARGRELTASPVFKPPIPFAPKSTFAVGTLLGTFEPLRTGRRAESRPPGARHEHGHRGFEHPSTRDIHGSSLFLYIQRRGDSTWAAPRGCLAWPARAWCR